MVGPLQVIEFFSGIGGWHRALESLDIRYEVKVAYDVNDAANKTYALNYGITPNKVRHITKCRDACIMCCLEVY